MTQGDYALSPEQHLSEIWHKALRNPAESHSVDKQIRSLSQFRTFDTNVLSCFLIVHFLFQ